MDMLNILVTWEHFEIEIGEGDHALSANKQEVKYLDVADGDRIARTESLDQYGKRSRNENRLSVPTEAREFRPKPQTVKNELDINVW